MKATLFGLLFFTLHLGPVNAQTPPVQELLREELSQQILSGTALRLKKTKHAVALTCSDEKCEIYQFLFLASDSRVFKLGKPFTFLQNTETKAVEIVVLEGSIKKHLASLHRQANRTRYQVVAASTLMLAMATFGLGPAGIVPFVWITGTKDVGMLTIMGLYAITMIADVAPNLIAPTLLIKEATLGRETESLEKQNGWNWSVGFKNVRKKYFSELMSQIDSNSYNTLKTMYPDLP